VKPEVWQMPNALRYENFNESVAVDTTPVGLESFGYRVKQVSECATVLAVKGGEYFTTLATRDATLSKLRADKV
jgi:hypothetical protein